jgi:WD40 repeat protein
MPQVWDSQTLQCMKTLEGHEDNVRVLAVGDRQVFSGSWDKTIRVWDLDTLECSKVRQQLTNLQPDHCEHPTAMTGTMYHKVKSAWQLHVM